MLTYVLAGIEAVFALVCMETLFATDHGRMKG
jgi:hypothetical protein